MHCFPLSTLQSLFLSQPQTNYHGFPPMSLSISALDQSPWVFSNVSFCPSRRPFIIFFFFHFVFFFFSPIWRLSLSNPKPTIRVIFLMSLFIYSRLQSISTETFSSISPYSSLTFLHFAFYSSVVPLGFIPWEIRVAFPVKSQLR